MNDIYFYDFDFNLLCIEKNCISSTWSLKYDDVGTFEAVFPVESDAVKTVLKNDYVIAVQGVNQAIVTGKIISKKATIYGKTLNWILTKRIVAPKTFNADGSAMVKDIIDEAFSDVENFETEEMSGIGDVNLELKSHTTALDVVKRCLDPLNFGHRVYADIVNKKWIFGIITQSDTDIIMSEDLKNVYNVEYADDMQNLFTDGVYVDENKASRTITSGKEGIYRWECLLEGETEDDAKDELSKKKRKAESRAMTRDFEYPGAFKLGDKVKVRKSCAGFERLTDVYIYGVNLWYDTKVYGSEPVFKEL